MEGKGKKKEERRKIEQREGDEERDREGWRQKGRGGKERN